MQPLWRPSADCTGHDTQGILTKCWAGGTGAINETEFAIDRNYIVRSIGADVRVAASLLAVVVLRARVWRRVVGEVRLHCLLLVGWKCEDVGKATTAVDDGLACFLRLGTGRKSLWYVDAWLDLRGANAGDVGACARERRVEAATSTIVVAAVRVDALA